MYLQAFLLVLVGALWGCTNPFIKLGSEGITDQPRRSNPLAQLFFDYVFLFSRWQVHTTK